MWEEYEQIKNSEGLRQNLICIKNELKDKGTGEIRRRELAARYESEPWVLEDLLENDDPKTRGNASLVLGEIGTEDCRDVIWRAYREETTLYVRVSYLKALQGCDCEDILDELKAERDSLLKAESTDETRKHLLAEIREIQALIGRYDKKRHRLSRTVPPVNVILTTWRDYRELTARLVTQGEVTFMGAGVLVRGGDMEELLRLRCYREMLFLLNVTEMEANPRLSAETLLSSDMLDVLDALCEGGRGYRFRLDCRMKWDGDARSAFAKSLASEMELLSDGALVNDPSDYEAEIRLLENKKGMLIPLLKLAILPDRRFSYRRQSTATSMQPALAALLMELARPYLRENARVLDPFCGVGTLLLERNYLVHADTLYGVDSYGDAVTAARINAETAGVPAHFIHRDFEGFTHEYLFDEIVTDMPAAAGRRTAHEVDMTYRLLFTRAAELLKSGSFIFVYAHDRGYAKKWIRETEGMKLEREWRISENEDAWFMAVRYGGSSAEDRLNSNAAAGDNVPQGRAIHERPVHKKAAGAKRWPALCLCLLLTAACVISGCASASSGASENEDGAADIVLDAQTRRIGLILTGRDAEENDEVTYIAEQLAESAGAKLTVCIPDVSAEEAESAADADLAETQSCDVNPIEYQMLAVNDLVAEDVDMIIIHANHYSGLESVLSAARSLGVTVIAYGAEVTEECCDIYVERAKDLLSF